MFDVVGHTRYIKIDKISLKKLINILKYLNLTNLLNRYEAEIWKPEEDFQKYCSYTNN